MASKKKVGSDGATPIEQIAAMGGEARKRALSKKERSEIARRGGLAKAAKAAGLPKETHTGTLKLGEGIPCSVLDNKTRVFSVRGLLRAFESGAKGRGALEDGTPVPSFLTPANVRPFISNDLIRQLTEPVPYRSMTGGRTALGYEATIIRKICDALLDARAAGVLRQTQLRTAQAAEALLRGFADVGIIALIDQATGYTADQASTELQRLVSLYVTEAMRPYLPLFRETFFQQVYRLHGWQYRPGVTQGPRCVAGFITKYVYGYLPPGSLMKLDEVNPIVGKRSQRRRKHHQHLTKDVGEPAVDRHLASVTTLMSVSADKKHFDEMVKVAFPRPGQQIMIGAAMRPPVLPAATIAVEEEVGEVAVGASMERESVVIDGVEIVNAERGVRERIVAMLVGGNTVGSGDMAEAVYGARSESALNKLRKMLGKLREDGVVESPSKGIWKLVPGSRA